MSEWISVNNRLPEETGYYLCTSKADKDEEYDVSMLCWSTNISPTIPERMKKNVFENGGAFGEMWSDGIDNIEEVVAWMPLPKPYKEK